MARRSSTRTGYGSRRPTRICARPDGHGGTVTDVTFLGPLTRYEVSVAEGLRLVVQTQTDSEEHFRKDDRVSLSWPPSAAVVLKD